MAKTSHRIRRNRARPQPGSVGASFRGGYLLVALVNLAGGVIELSTRIPNASGTSFDIPPIWTPDQEINPGGMIALDTGAPVSPTSIVVGPAGTDATITFPAALTFVQLYIPSGDPNWIGNAGQQCGGIYLEA